MAAIIDLNSDMGESFGAYTLGQDEALDRSKSVVAEVHREDASIELAEREIWRHSRMMAVRLETTGKVHDRWGIRAREIKNFQC